MAVSPEDVLRCARDMAAQPNLKEANSRAIIGRAYYSAFHECRIWHAALPAVGVLHEGFDGGMHAALSTRLLNPSPSLPADRKSSSIKRGIRLRALHAERCKADYELDLSLDDADARNAINEAITIKGLS